MTSSNFFRVNLLFDSGERIECGAIEHEGAIWLVPKWIGMPDEGYAKPERMIRLDQFAHQKLGPPHPDFFVNDPIPRALFESGRLSPELQKRFVVLDRPDLRFQTGGKLN
jgi:hypothetical protein